MSSADSNAFHIPDWLERETFCKRSGTTDSGKDYEDIFTAFVSHLESINDAIEDFWVSSNDPNFNSLDDVVTKVQFRNEVPNWYALQLKHSEPEDKAKTKNDEGKSLSLPSLAATSGKFSLQAYRDSVTKDKKLKDLPVDRFKFVLYTNRTLSAPGELELKLPNNRGFGIKIVPVGDSHDKFFEFINTGGNVFRLEAFRTADQLTKEDQDDLDQFQRFFQQFYLFTNQQDEKSLRVSTVRLFKELYDCDDDVAESYVRFVSAWSKHLGKKTKLRREVVITKIQELLLTPFTRKEVTGTNLDAQLKVLEDAVLENDLTIVDDTAVGATIDNMWSAMSDPEPIDEVSEIGFKFNVFTKKPQTLDELDPSQLAKIMWYRNRLPLVIKYETDQWDAVFKAIMLGKHLLNKKKLVLVGPNLISRQDFAGFKLFENLYDLRHQGRTFRTIVNEFKCSLGGEEAKTIADHVADYEEITKIFTAADLFRIANNDAVLGEDNLEKKKILVEGEIDKVFEDGNTRLHRAIQAGSKLARFLIWVGAQVDLVNSEGLAPLHLASLAGNPEVTHLLIANRAEVNSRDKDGNTPLHVAAATNQPEVVKILVKRMESVNVRNGNNVTPLHLAAHYGHTDIVKYLLSIEGIDINVTDNNGDTPLSSALWHHIAVDTVEALLDGGANCATANVYGYSPLHLTAAGGLWKLIRSFGLPELVNSPTETGDTPLLLAAMNGHLEVVRALVELGANTEAVGNNGVTALHCAAFAGDFGMVKFLADKTDVDVRNEFGDTPCAVAEREGHREIFEFLREVEGA